MARQWRRTGQGGGGEKKGEKRDATAWHVEKMGNRVEGFEQGDGVRSGLFGEEEKKSEI